MSDKEAMEIMNEGRPQSPSFRYGAKGGTD